MQLTGERLIPASVSKTWAALNNPEILKACIKGCEKLEQTADDEFDAARKMRIRNSLAEWLVNHDQPKIIAKSKRPWPNRCIALPDELMTFNPAKNGSPRSSMLRSVAPTK